MTSPYFAFVQLDSRTVQNARLLIIHILIWILACLCLCCWWIGHTTLLQNNFICSKFHLHCFKRGLIYMSYDCVNLRTILTNICINSKINCLVFVQICKALLFQLTSLNVTYYYVSVSILHTRQTHKT